MTTDPMQREMGQVYVVDDDPDVSRSIAWTLNSVGYTVGNYPVAAEFLSQATISDPSAVLVDMLLPGMTGLDLCREIATRRMPCAFAMMSGHADVPSAVEAMHLGAIDLLEKPFSRERLLAVVNRILQIARVNQKSRVEEDDATRRLQELSPRERDVFEAVAAGLATKEIAKHLGVSTRTVDVHRSRIMQKLGLRSPLALANLLAILERRAIKVPSATG